MLPKMVQVKVHVRDAVPADADAVAVLLPKGGPVPAGLGEREAAAVAALVEAGVATGRAGEVAVHLLQGGKRTRLMVVGHGRRGQAG